MKYFPEKKEIKLDRKLNNLDRFVLDFCNLLDSYVVVSGYVSILFGRSRATEDVDLLVPEMNFKEFKTLWEKISKNGFECINTSDVSEAFNMLKEISIRFCKKGMPVPNMEFKMIKTGIGKYAFENKIKVTCDKHVFWISPLELQIAYKLFLAADGTDKELISDKDIEDAVYLYNIFKEKINKKELLYFSSRFGVNKRLRLLK